MTTDKQTAWLAGLGLALVMLIGALIEPCDGKSCQNEINATGAIYAE